MKENKGIADVFFFISMGVMSGLGIFILIVYSILSFFPSKKSSYYKPIKEESDHEFMSKIDCSLKKDIYKQASCGATKSWALMKHNRKKFNEEIAAYGWDRNQGDLLPQEIPKYLQRNDFRPYANPVVPTFDALLKHHFIHMKKDLKNDASYENCKVQFDPYTFDFKKEHSFCKQATLELVNSNFELAAKLNKKCDLLFICYAKFSKHSKY